MNKRELKKACKKLGAELTQDMKRAAEVGTDQLAAELGLLVENWTDDGQRLRTIRDAKTGEHIVTVRVEYTENGVSFFDAGRERKRKAN